MQEEFDKAVSALKSSNVGKRGRDALYLPALVRDHRSARRRQDHRAAQLGPASSRTCPRAARARRRRHAQLRLVADQRSHPARHRRPLDTAGRRPRRVAGVPRICSRSTARSKPLNGITGDQHGRLSTRDDDEVEALAPRMRERIDEVIGQLRRVDPGLRAVHQVRPDRGLRRDVPRAAQHRSAVRSGASPRRSRTNIGEPGKHFDRPLRRARRRARAPRRWRAWARSAASRRAS